MALKFTYTFQILCTKIFLTNAASMQNTEMLVKILKDFCRCGRVDNYGII